MKYKYKTLICINNTLARDKLVIGKHYKGAKFNDDSDLYLIYDKDDPVGIFGCNNFKNIKQLRNEKINHIL